MKRMVPLLRRLVAVGCLGALVSVLGIATASAGPNVLMMPDRDATSVPPRGAAFKGRPIVVWGRTTLPTTTCTLAFGDGTSIDCAGFDKTYIASTHTYTAAGPVTATLTVNGESEIAKIVVEDPAALSPERKRALMINNAIEDGLRFLYVNQCDRTAVSNTQSWMCNPFFGSPAYEISYTSLAVLAFENHNHLVTNNDPPNPPKDIYQDTVQRGLNFIFDNLSTVELTVQPAGDPCVGGIGPAPCTGLGQTADFPSGYSTSIATLAVASSGAPTRVVTVPGTRSGGFVTGKTYANILQRQVSTIAWAQADSGFNEGGWRYDLNDNDSDGSAIGWAVLALFDGNGAGATVPAFVPTKLATVIQNTSCPQPAADLSNGLSYAGCGNGNVLRTGVALQSLHFMGVADADARVTNAKTYVSTAWDNFHPNGEDFDCAEGADSLGTGSPTGSRNNKGCAYAMYQVFKGLKFYGVTTLPGVSRPANVLVDPANPPNLLPRVGAVNDWYEDYRDYLVANQQDPTVTGGGNWAGTQLGWSCCDSADTPSNNGVSALAVLILAPTFVPPCCIDLAPLTASNQVGTNHTVTAHSTGAVGGPGLPGVTVTFTVTAGPNIGMTGTGISNASGDATFTYSSAVAGTDTIQANVGSVTSNTVSKTWTNPGGGHSLDALSPAHLWVGLKTSDDQGTRVDVKVELLRNGASLVPEVSGLLRCVNNVARNPAAATEAIVPWTLPGSVQFGALDVLSVRVSTRIGTNANDTKCVPGPGGSHNSATGLRLYYDSPTRQSRFDATITPNANQNLYLHSNGLACPANGPESPNVTSRTLDATAPTAVNAKCKDSGIIHFTGGNPFVVIGTWSLAPLP